MTVRSSWLMMDAETVRSKDQPLKRTAFRIDNTAQSSRAYLALTRPAPLAPVPRRDDDFKPGVSKHETEVTFEYKERCVPILP
jgi:hypothetical protein